MYAYNFDEKTGGILLTDTEALCLKSHAPSTLKK